MVPAIVSVAEGEHRRGEVAEVLVELEDFAFDLGELPVRADSDRPVQRVPAVGLPARLHGHFLEVVWKLLGVPLDEDWIDLSSAFLIEEALL